MTERIDTKAVLDGMNATIRGNGKPSSETLLVWWKALAQEIADQEAAQARIEALTELLQLRPILDIAFIDWAKWCKRVTTALAAKETP